MLEGDCEKIDPDWMLKIIDQFFIELHGKIIENKNLWNLIDAFEFYSAAPTVFPSENPVFTLFYFNVKALAEPIRFLFAYGAQEYEDVRVTRDEWPALKPSKFYYPYAVRCEFQSFLVE